MYDFLKKHLFDDRCLIYFNHLEKSNPDWLINPHEQISYDKTAFQLFESFKKSKMDEHNKDVKAAESDGRDPPDPPTESDMRIQYNKLWKEVESSEQILHDFLAHVRIFDKCYIQSQDATILRNDTAYVKRQRYFLKHNVDYLADPDEVVDGSVYRNKLLCSQVETKVFPWLTMQYPTFTRANGEKSYFPGNDYRIHESRGCFLNEFKKDLMVKAL